MDKILITGGSGFIGSHFHRYMDQDKIVNLDLVRPEFAFRSTYVQGDIRNEEDIVRALEGNDVTSILSLAAKHHDFGIGHDEYFDTNEGGTEALCRAADRFGIKEIIFYSSVAVYGVSPEISHEGKEPSPDSPYGASKLAGEKVLRDWAAKDSSRKVLILRPTVVFGENNRANMYSLIRQISSGLYFHLGAAANIKSIAYVENLVEATLFLKERLQSGVTVYNYADEPQLTAREIGETIAAALGRKVRFTLPMPLVTLMSLPFDAAIKITGRNLPISSARVRKLSTATHHSAQKLFDAGFVPRNTTRDGLRKMVSWYLEEKNNVRQRAIE